LQTHCKTQTEWHPKPLEKNTLMQTTLSFHCNQLNTTEELQKTYHYTTQSQQKKETVEKTTTPEKAEKTKPQKTPNHWQLPYYTIHCQLWMTHQTVGGSIQLAPNNLIQFAFFSKNIGGLNLMETGSYKLVAIWEWSQKAQLHVIALLKEFNVVWDKIFQWLQPQEHTKYWWENTQWSMATIGMKPTMKPINQEVWHW